MEEYVYAKSILSPLKNGRDPYFGIDYSMNLYRGCQHQCIYCDTRSKVYGVGDLAEIKIKKNAIELLEKKLKSLKRKGTISTGSMNDPYMPIELQEKLTRRALEIIEKYKYPIHILTKSNIVTRDIDLLNSIKNIYAAVSFTITTADDNLSLKIEPGAPKTSKRLNTMYTLSKQGIYTGAILTPVLPFITDSIENIKEIINLVSGAGGKYIIGWMGMTQREGQREYFYNKLDKLFPGTRDKYMKEFGNNYNCPPLNATLLYETFNQLCYEKNIETKMDFYTPKEPNQLKLFT